MDYSQYIRLKQEAANVYVSRAKTVDASMVTMRKQQISAFAGAANLHTPTYYRGGLVVDPINDLSSNQYFTNGYRGNQIFSNNNDLTLRRAGAVLSTDVDYSTAPPGIQLLNPSTASTILTSYNNNAFKASVFQNQEEVIRYVYPINLPSMYFNGNAFVQLSTDPVYTGNSDFTIEFFIRPPSGPCPDTQTIFYTGAPASVDTYKLKGNLIKTRVGTTTPLVLQAYTISVQVSTRGTYTFGELLENKWHHVALMRFGTRVYFFLNGTNMGSLEVGTNIPSSAGSTTYLSGDESTTSVGGAYDTGYVFANGFIGNLTNFRWTKGMAVYTRSLGVPYVTSVLLVFKVQFPLYVHVSQDPFTTLDPYVAVTLLAETAATVITPTHTPTATVSTTDGNTISNSYTTVSWQIV